MAAGDARIPTYVLTLEAMEWAIDDLRVSRIHPFFLAYLHLHRRSAELGTTSAINPHWDELADALRVPGGPPGKPFYRPFWHGNSDDPTRYWLNPNIAGSYAPSSLRTLPLNVVETFGSDFALKPDHVQLARQHLLYDQPISSVALAAFFYRNFGFTTDIPGLSPSDLPAVLREDYRFSEDDFQILFEDSLPPDLNWFEPLGAME